MGGVEGAEGDEGSPGCDELRLSFRSICICAALGLCGTGNEEKKKKKK